MMNDDFDIVGIVAELMMACFLLTGVIVVPILSCAMIISTIQMLIEVMK